MTMSPSPEVKAGQEAAAADVATVNPGSPIVKPAWKTATFWVSVAGALSALGAQIPQIAAALPEGKGKSTLLTIGIILASLGSVLSQRGGVTAAMDVHTAMARKR